jgi:hypothetical protein
MCNLSQLARFATLPILFLALCPLHARALTQTRGEITVSVEPVVGFEHVQKLAPTPHTTNRLMYGARATAGWRIVAAEAELTRGTDAEAFPLQALTTSDTDEKLKVGVRSSYALSSMLSAYLRGGVQAKRNTREETSAGVTTRTVGRIVYDPYAGTGLSAGLARNVSLNVGLAVVFNEFPDMAKNDYQTTAGFSVRFP